MGPKTKSLLRRAVHHPFDFVQRWVSRFIWAQWLIDFLFWELTGTLPYTPWRTLSETAWDVEKEYPGTKRYLEAFLLGLVVHIRYRTTLESSIQWGLALEARFDQLVGLERRKAP